MVGGMGTTYHFHPSVPELDAELHLTSFVLSFIFPRTEKLLFKRWSQFSYL